jgi:PAS domain S-box-containing protein
MVPEGMTLSTRGIFSARFTERHWSLRYGLAVVVYGAVMGIALLNQRQEVKLNLTIPIVFGLVAVVWYGGRGPGILISLLFEATTIAYSPAPPDGSYAKEWFGFLSTLLLYLFLVFVISGFQKAGRTIAEQRDLLHVTLSSIGDGVVTTDTHGNVTFMNRVAETLTGWRLAEARGRPLGGAVNIVNEETGQEVSNPGLEALQTGQTIGLANHSLLVSRDGQRIPIDDSAAPIRDGEATRGVVLVFSDVTERKLAERARRETEIMHCIVEAQESERNRIARGLHDQLGQQMTALRLKVEALARKCGDSEIAFEDVADVQKAATEIDRDLGFLSWELKPTELEELGLMNALSSFVREWSKQYGISAEFESTLDHEPDLTRQTQTNLYRIAQEALNNVLRHADAKNVSVLLQRQRSNLVFIVEDDGIGFEQNGHGSGLGITGMRERAALLKGDLKVDSRPGEGTVVIVRIPYDAEDGSPAVVA